MVLNGEYRYILHCTVLRYILYLYIYIVFHWSFFDHVHRNYNTESTVNHKRDNCNKEHDKNLGLILMISKKYWLFWDYWIVLELNFGGLQPPCSSSRRGLGGPSGPLPSGGNLVWIFFTQCSIWFSEKCKKKTRSQTQQRTHDPPPHTVFSVPNRKHISYWCGGEEEEEGEEENVHLLTHATTIVQGVLVKN